MCTPHLTSLVSQLVQEGEDEVGWGKVSSNCGTGTGKVSFQRQMAHTGSSLSHLIFLCRAWKQDEVVRKFLLEPPKSKRGLPSRPVTGNAVSIRLNLEQSIIAEWFGSK